MAATLLEIPAEILACIADELDIEHYASLRLANRQIHQYTFPYFAKKFFARRKFFRGHLSLSTLLAISQSPLSPYLETLILGTEVLEFFAPDAPNISKEAYYKAYADQTCMLASGWDRDTLVDSLRNLPNLKAVGVESFDDREVWDDDSQRASVIDGGYGLKTLLSSLGYEAGRPPSQSTRAAQWVTTTQTLLYAVAKSGAKPKSFSIRWKPVNTGYIPSEATGIDDDGFNIPTFMEPTLLPFIEGLQELDFEAYNRMIFPGPEDSATCRTCHLRRFLGLPKELKKLRIARLRHGGLVASQNNETRGGFWTWLGWSPKGKEKEVAGGGNHDDNAGREPWQWEAIPPSNRNPLVSIQPIALPHLQELHLADENILLENMTRLLRKIAPTLVKLDLHSVILCDVASEAEAAANNNGSDSNPTDEVRTEVDSWIALCGALAAMPVDELREVNISDFSGLSTWHLNRFAWDEHIAAAPESVHFRVLRIVGDNTYDSMAKFSYKGPDVRGALRHLADDLRAAVRDGRHVFVSEPSKRRNSF